MLKEASASGRASGLFLRHSSAFDAFDALTDALAVVDASGVIRYGNKAWYRFSGLASPGTSDNSTGLTALAAYGCIFSLGGESFRKLSEGLLGVLGGNCDRFDLDCGLNSEDDGKVARRWFSLVATPCEVSGERGALIHLRDVSAQKQTELALRASEDSLLRAQQIARMGNWDWDIPSGELRWSDEIFRIFGRKPREFKATYEAFLNTIHHEDRDAVVMAVNQAVNEHAPYSIEHRIVRPSGEVRYVSEQGRVFCDEAGSPLRMIGTVQDITERRMSEEIIRSQAAMNEELEQMVESRTEELQIINERLEYELEQREKAERARAALQDEIIHMQSELLDELSTPLIPIRDDILVLPLIGAIDSRRAEQMLDMVLRGVAAQRAKVVIIDITGVKQVDANVATALVRTAAALGLIGAKVVLTGMRPEVARMLVELDLPFEKKLLVVRGTLQSGIDYATGVSGKRC